MSYEGVVKNTCLKAWLVKRKQRTFALQIKKPSGIAQASFKQ